MFGGSEFSQIISDLGVSHVVWLPDSVIGLWEADLTASSVQLIRVCREGEAWPLAAGLMMGGQRPLVMMQTTGLFESGDALRHVVYDLSLPVYAFIGARNALNVESKDSARRFTQPLLDAWQVDLGYRNTDNILPLCAACAGQHSGVEPLQTGKIS